MYYVSLPIRELPEDPSVRYYALRVLDEDKNVVAEIPLMEDSATSGMSLEKWKHSTRKRDKGKNVIGVYFWISAMGHELDQWRYYDLDLGKDVTK